MCARLPPSDGRRRFTLNSRRPARTSNPSPSAIITGTRPQMSRRSVGWPRQGLTVVCTLKDAVTLGHLWPREAPPIWYVSQRVELERGADRLYAALDAIAGASQRQSRKAVLHSRPVAGGASGRPAAEFPTMATELRLPTHKIVRPDKDRFLNEENPFEAMMSRFDRAAELLDLGAWDLPGPPKSGKADHHLDPRSAGQRRRRSVHRLSGALQHVPRARPRVGSGSTCRSRSRKSKRSPPG